MRYPIEYEGQVLLLPPELAGTIYHLRAHGVQRIPRAHVSALRERGVKLLTHSGRGVQLVEGCRPSEAQRAETGVRLHGRVAEVDGTKIVLMPSQAALLRAAMAGEPVELTPSNQAQAYRMRKEGIPIRFSTRCGGYYIGDKV